MTTPPPDQPAKRTRSLTGFYVAIGVVVTLGLLGAWWWTARNHWWFDTAEAQRRQTAAARQLGLPVEKVVDLGDGVKIELVLIPAGRFRMGDQGGQDERFGHQWVRITKPFYIGKYEVTQEVWRKVMGTNPSKFEGARNPVENVSWDDCQEFLKKLNALGKECGQFRLPTEAEWEWACRAGTRTRFSFGNGERSLADYGWCEANSGKAPHPVGMKKPNAWGLFDMHGNVWEWCGDWYYGAYYGECSRADPSGPPTGAGRVLRGGSWDGWDGEGFFQSAYRGCYVPVYRFDNQGFRLAVSPSRAQ